MPLKPRTDKIMVRLTPEEMAALNKAAQDKGERPSTIARDVLVRWARRVNAA